MNFRVPLFKIYWDSDDIEAIKKVVERGSYWATGPEIEAFEKAVAKYVDRKYGVAFNSGTSALHAVLLAYGIGQGDEVIVPSFTFISTANAPLFVGAKPVFADIEPISYGLDAEDVEKRITEKTKAIMPIHYAGGACKDIKRLVKLAKEYNLILIEDAAESLGAILEGRKVGSFGDAAMFSFCQNKVITCGEGGIIVTDSKETYEKLKLIRSHGRREFGEGYFSGGKVDYVELGYNFRMPSMIAALGLSQISKIEKIIKWRRERAFYYSEMLKHIDHIEPPQELPNSRHVFQMYTIKVKKNRDSLMRFLKSHGVFCKIYFDPVHRTTLFKHVLNYNCRLPETEQISSKVLTLPLYPHLSKEEQDYVISLLKKWEKNEN